MLTLALVQTHPKFLDVAATFEHGSVDAMVEKHEVS